MGIMERIYKCWREGRKNALLYLWRKKMWVQDDIQDIVPSIVRFVQGLDIKSLHETDFLTPQEYARKYNMKLPTVYTMFRRGKLRGAKVGGKIVLVDEPLVRKSEQKFKTAIGKIETWGLHGLGARPVALRATPLALVRALAPSLHPHKVLEHFKSVNRLFKIRGHYYILFSRIGDLSLAELKELYPDPNDIIIPKLRKKVQWGEVELWNNS